MLETTSKDDVDVWLQPSMSHWAALVASPTGELFGQTLEYWRSAALLTLGLPSQKSIVIVGHQPIFFHPGILAKFIAAHHVVTQVSGILVHLVVDHYQGNSGVIDVPVHFEATRTVLQKCIATLDPHIAMKDQNRIECVERFEPFTDALNEAQGTNAAIQFAHATDALMSQWVTVHHVIASSDLLRTSLGKEILEEMMRDPHRCITAYNDAVKKHPECGMQQLADGELPLWQGKYNSTVSAGKEDLRPRALLLTLLARLTIGDLFVHGTGGANYDKIMESWLYAWLGVQPCNATMATATLTLPPAHAPHNELRRQYYSPVGESKKKQEYLDAITQSPYGSSLRQTRYLAMHKWLSSIGTRPDAAKLRHSLQIANRRDWAFSLYPQELINQLRDVIVQS